MGCAVIAIRGCKLKLLRGKLKENKINKSLINGSNPNNLMNMLYKISPSFYYLNSFIIL